MACHDYYSKMTAEFRPKLMATRQKIGTKLSLSIVRAKAGKPPGQYGHSSFAGWDG